jgi:hypothetical protein
MLVEMKFKKIRNKQDKEEKVLPSPSPLLFPSPSPFLFLSPSVSE